MGHGKDTRFGQATKKQDLNILGMQTLGRAGLVEAGPHAEERDREAARGESAQRFEAPSFSVS